ncbi:sulfite exporter TauE/SafE family protein [Komagataeibacter sp. AV436]|uniref:Probable membrane transporter protein n=1 Tax=Komagataeibacter melomenusus TaxID=2766578 RepID=A0ABX2ACZ8_9PROT|nr:sulfite exporter TauE/SafE family protein [Komagataeibacter melomenusus]MBV1829940.1 sulfite exporter TauE/SafE family protein [Komagataeibacter melomenusus]NPC66001.1 sulfite exporter TauE/SafE family protein [Komagataeibacter melomenusus]
MANLAQVALGLGSGGIIGFTLGLVGGGGSILAVPLLLYVVGMSDPHRAIGTSAVAVTVNALFNLASHARAGNVRWACASVFAGAGVGGALVGAACGKIINGQHLLFLFALVMLGVGGLMARGCGTDAQPPAPAERTTMMPVLLYGVATGFCSGFFGIGGGFLIVPALLAATGMPMLNAIATSLVAVCAFGLTTSVSYGAAGMVDLPMAAILVAGGTVGGLGGTLAARRLGRTPQRLRLIFACLIFIVALYMMWRSARAMGLV